MNIFVSSPCPNESAKALDDKRVIKMTLESAQLLSTAINCHGGTGPYKATHVNHPCSMWVRKNRSNYLWLYFHFLSLCSQYTKRYNKIHKCESFAKVFKEYADKIPKGKITEFANCTSYKEIKNVHTAYKLYLNDKWDNDKRKPTWFKQTKGA